MAVLKNRTQGNYTIVSQNIMRRVLKSLMTFVQPQRAMKNCTWLSILGGRELKLSSPFKFFIYYLHYAVSYLPA